MRNFIYGKIKDKGITLIALVITIVVLIILVGVTVNTFLGEGGVFDRAKEAIQHYINAQGEEQDKIKDLYASMKFAVDGTITLDAETLEEFVQDMIDESVEEKQLVSQSDLTSNNLNKIYPVGSIYISTSSTNPGTYLGGTWEQLKDRFLLGAGDTYAAAATGGQASHQHNYMIRYGTYWGTLVGGGANMLQAYNYNTSSYVDSAASVDTSRSVNSSLTGSTKTISNTTLRIASGNTSSTSNLPPYLVVYMWKRTS